MVSVISGAVVPPLIWFAFTVFQFHRVVQQDGSWYNEMKMDDRFTYWNRVKYTATERLKLGRTIAFNLLIGAALSAVGYVMAVGLANIF